MTKENLVAWYPFNDTADLGKDISGNENHATAKGTTLPTIDEVAGRTAVTLHGGSYGASYLELPKEILKDVDDNGGFTVSTWIHGNKASNVWERVFDFGNGMTGPYLFMTRFLRGVCFAGSDLVADGGKGCPEGQWAHIAMTVTGTKTGSLSSAGPRVYINGELVGDGFISQTSSGTYKQLREWFAELADGKYFENNFIGHSQFDADADLCASLSDFRIYKDALSEDEIIGLMCEALSDEDILVLARDKFLPTPDKIITKDIDLPAELMEGRVQVEWKCSNSCLSSNGDVHAGSDPIGVTITAVLTCNGKTLSKEFQATVMPENIPPYELTIHGDKKVLDISKTLYGLFYEDINNAADGGIYAEMIQNRSFEDFTFEVYDARSGEDGKSAGRNYNPLHFWFGDLDKVTPMNKGGLNEHFAIEDEETNIHYVVAQKDACLYNRGFCDNNLAHSMNILKDNNYHFSIWAKAEQESKLSVTLLNDKDEEISNTITITVSGGNTWNKYYGEVLTATDSAMGHIRLHFENETAIDMVSLMPEDVWGAKEEENSPSAHKNYSSNENYRLRKDLVQAMADMHPAFLRFPGGCISEGSYIWDNVYDWKDSVGDVAVRKENYNVWGYVMTMGLGYMEYFQLAEDLNAEPLPVMACGVLCQARSDYANPAGGKLQEKYIKNFTDLIDFAISTDFENNTWAALRKEMGHEEPFGLHYLGVGNENWGSEFFASFEDFMVAIEAYVQKNYPGYDLTIISTAGAQADDDAYQQGWKFLTGCKKGGDTVAFTDGEKSFTKEVTWYPYERKNYLHTIVDEHYYRANDYLLENADRYNYYYRPYQDGKLVEDQVSKVFVGEYASSDKNTLAGAVAEAAVMTGFENNSDVVRLAATAPLFNKVVTDGTYRWTPDAIWFDNQSVWRTPNYYVQQLFAKYLGDELLASSYETYVDGKKTSMIPSGGISIMVAEGDVLLKKLTVTCNECDDVIFEQDFSAPLSDNFCAYEAAGLETTLTEKGLKISVTTPGKHGYYLVKPEWKNYTVSLEAEKLTENAEIFVGAGLSGASEQLLDFDKVTLHEYCLGMGIHGTGLKVYKDGKEGYTMGDYSSSVFTGNQRACFDKAVTTGSYTIHVNFGGKENKTITCFYEDDTKQQKALLDYKLAYYNRDVFHSITRDKENVYIKLVNADDFTKDLKVKFQDLTAKEKATVITLTASEEFVHALNVNNKEKEQVVPVSSSLPVEKDGFNITLPANSVTIVVLDY